MTLCCIDVGTFLHFCYLFLHYELSEGKNVILSALLKFYFIHCHRKAISNLGGLRSGQRGKMQLGTWWFSPFKRKCLKSKIV